MRSALKKFTLSQRNVPKIQLTDKLDNILTNAILILGVHLWGPQPTQYSISQQKVLTLTVYCVKMSAAPDKQKVNEFFKLQKENIYFIYLYCLISPHTQS